MTEQHTFTSYTVKTVLRRCGHCRASWEASVRAVGCYTDQYSRPRQQVIGPRFVFPVMEQGMDDHHEARMLALAWIERHKQAVIDTLERA